MTHAIEQTTPALDTRKLAPGFGAEIRGLDLSRPLDAAMAAALRAAFDRHLVLLFRGQRLPPERHIEFSRLFGELQIHVLDQYQADAHPEIFVLSNVGPDGKTRGKHPDRGTLTWHTDGSFQRRPALATLLYADEVPADGGHTLFADTLAAYEALPATERARIDGWRVVHDLNRSRIRSGYGPIPEAQRAKAPPVEHKLVRTHPPTGRKGIYIGNHAQEIVGIDPLASRGELEYLTQHATQPQFVYDHEWASGDLLMWDNRAVLHRATAYDTTIERRIVRRTVVIGDEPV